MLKKIAFASAGFLLLASPLLVSAQTATDIQARIGALLAQLTQLQEQLASQTGQQPATPSVSPTLTPSSTSGGCAQIITRFLIVGSPVPGHARCWHLRAQRRYRQVCLRGGRHAQSCPSWTAHRDTTPRAEALTPMGVDVRPGALRQLLTPKSPSTNNAQGSCLRGIIG